MEVLSSAAITESLAGGGGVRGSSAEMLRPQKVLIIHHRVAKCHQTRFRWQKPSQLRLTLRASVSRMAVVVEEPRL